MLAHESLDIYKTYIEYAALSAGIVECAENWHAFSDHLERATESIGANMVRANCQHSIGSRRSFIDIATGSLLECVACLDVANAKKLLQADDLVKGRLYLWHIRGMLAGLRKTTSGFVREESPLYGKPKFPHDRLDVYHATLCLLEWTHRFLVNEKLPIRRRNRFDATTTGILLNIAEGCGKTGKTDKLKYLDLSYGHALQSALSLDLLVSQDVLQNREVAIGKSLLERIVAMLLAWIHGLRKDIST